MPFTIVEVGTESLREYSTVPIAFEVQTMFRVDPIDGGLGGITLTEEPVGKPYIKDYDTSDEGGPDRWGERFDLSNWGFFIGYEDRTPICCAAVAFDTPGVHMLCKRRDLAVLWDIRVMPGMRRSGVGTKIFAQTLEWARSRGARQMKIETQNINVPACRFYRRMGCSLGEINAHAYAHDPSVAHEVMLVWYLDL
jgi:GNAT superfamily N-acetyltransferase